MNCKTANSGDINPVPASHGVEHSRSGRHDSMDVTHGREQPTTMTVAWDAPLIGRFVEVDGTTVVRYYTSLADAAAAITDDDVQRVLALCGAWRDIDWDEMSAELNRIRHESQPTPPIDLDEIE
jgi:hypothetical protein